MNSTATGKPLVKQTTAMVKPLPVRASYPDRHPGGGPQPGQYKKVSCFNANHLGSGPQGGQFAPGQSHPHAAGALHAASQSTHPLERKAHEASSHAYSTGKPQDHQKATTAHRAAQDHFVKVKNRQLAHEHGTIAGEHAAYAKGK